MREQVESLLMALNKAESEIETFIGQMGEAPEALGLWAHLRAIQEHIGKARAQLSGSGATDPQVGDRALTECTHCHLVKECVYGPDPYASEINDDDTPMWLCESCYQDQVDAI